MSARVDEIRDRLKAATPGPWFLRGNFNVHGTFHSQDIVGLDDESMVAVELDATQEDAEFIAHAPDDVRWLLSRVAELESGNEQKEPRA